MWQEYSSHHTQRGDVTAVVWGAPGAFPEGEKSAAALAGSGSWDDSTCRSASSRSTPPGAAVVNAEALTRGRRAETPFVQQCDLVFPLPDQDSGNDGSGGGDDVLKEQEVREAGGGACKVICRVLVHISHRHTAVSSIDTLNNPDGSARCARDFG